MMNQNKSYTWAAIVAGILFLLMALLQLIASPIGISYVLILGYFIIAIALFIRKRNALMIVGGIIASLATVVLTFNSILITFRYLHIYNVINSLLNLTNIAGIVLFTVIAARSKTPENRAKIKNMWFLPAILMIVSDILMMVIGTVFGWGGMYGLTIVSSLIGYAIVFLSFLFAGMWLCLDGDKVNANAAAAPYAPAAAPAYAPPAQAPQSVPEELKLYIDLVNSGAITVEEYEAKRKQILGE